MSKPVKQEKKTPEFDLAVVKAAFADPKRLWITGTARRGMQELDFETVDLVAAVQSLTKDDFDKSMTSDHRHNAWQDVYKPNFRKEDLYIKFTDNGEGILRLLVLSFKRK